MYEVFEKLMKEKGVNATQVSKETGVTRSTFTDWKMGRLTPKQNKIKKIADYFGVDVSVFYGESEPEKVYYDKATEKIAQKIYDSKRLSLLFEAAADADPQDVQTAYQMLLALKRKERND